MMKKCYFALIVILMAAVSVGLASCSDDDEPKSADIVGTWQRNVVGIGGGLDTLLLKFTKDGKYHEVNSYIVNNVDKVDIFHGTYTVSGHKLTVTYIFQYENEAVECDYSVNGDKLTLNIEGEGPATFTRVKDSVIEPYL